MEYKRVSFTVSEDFADILIAELNETGYDSFSYEGEMLEAFIDKEAFNEKTVEAILEKYKDSFTVQYTHSDLEHKNWNEEWERNFQPVLIADKCLIRASFHPTRAECPYEIIINPKMSFGTGHHQTTALMIENMLALDLHGKKVMDAGSGTGILALFAEKLGASEIFAFDMEDWAFTNMAENIALNNCSKILLKQGTIRKVNPPGLFEVIVANINKNVLLDEIEEYAKYLLGGGSLLLSGFFREDSTVIIQRAEEFNLSIIKETSKDNWACLVLSKKSTI